MCYLKIFLKANIYHNTCMQIVLKKKIDYILEPNHEVNNFLKFHYLVNFFTIVLIFSVKRKRIPKGKITKNIGIT